MGKPKGTIGDQDYGPVMSVAIDTSGAVVAAGYHEGQIRTFDLASGGWFP